MSSSAASTNAHVPDKLQDPVKQSFLQAYVHKQLWISKLLPPHDSSDMETDEIELRISPDGTLIELDKSILTHMKSKLLLSLQNRILLTKLTLSMILIITAI